MYAERIEDHKRKGQSRKEEFRRHPLTGSCRQRSTIPQKKVNGSEGAMVAEMSKMLPLEKVYEVTMCFQGRFMGLEVGDCEAGVLAEA